MINDMIFLTTPQLVFVIVIPLLIILIGILCFIIIYKKKNIRKTFRNDYYKRIYEIVLNNDFLLINQFPVDIGSKERTYIDHIILGEKFIYIITDFCFEGTLMGKGNDPSLIFTNQQGQKSYIDNPIQINRKFLYCFSLSSGIDSSLLQGISLINDSCFYKVDDVPTGFNICNKSSVSKLIREIESNTNVKKLNQTQLQEAAKMLANIKEKMNAPDETRITK